MKNNGADDAWLKSIGGWTQSSRMLNDVYFTHESNERDTALANNFFYNLDKVKAE